MARKLIIAGNWKMNKTPSETRKLISEIKAEIPKSHKSEFILCPPFISIPAALEEAKDSSINIGAQNCHWEEKGAFTGEISPKMLSELGINYVIIGHSERRAYFGETDETVNKRIKSSLNEGITPILCVGENLTQRENGETQNIIKNQLELDFKDIDENSAEKIIIAYEPIWAIGTGKTATDNQAQEICEFIRNTIGKMFSAEVSEKIHILYGGSMNDKNAEGLLSMPDIDGGLIGGASLKADSIAQILKTADIIIK